MKEEISWIGCISGAYIFWLHLALLLTISNEEFTFHNCDNFGLSHSKDLGRSDSSVRYFGKTAGIFTEENYSLSGLLGLIKGILFLFNSC